MRRYVLIGAFVLLIGVTLNVSISAVSAEPVISKSSPGSPFSSMGSLIMKHTALNMMLSEDRNRTIEKCSDCNQTFGFQELTDDITDHCSENIAYIKTGASEISAPEIAWQICLGGSRDDSASEIRQTKDGGYIVVGSTDSNDGDVIGNHGPAGYDVSDIWLVKLTSGGAKQWQKCFGGSYHDFGYSVWQTNDGGYVVAGETITLNVNGGDAWLIKTDSTGKEEWNKTFGGADLDEAYSVQQTKDGGYIVAGYTESYSNGGDAWLIKTDSTGKEEWSRTYGGSLSDTGSSVQQTSDGGYILAGYNLSSTICGSAAWDKCLNPCLIKTDASGNRIWGKKGGKCLTCRNCHKCRHMVGIDRRVSYDCRARAPIAATIPMPNAEDSHLFYFILFQKSGLRAYSNNNIPTTSQIHSSVGTGTPFIMAARGTNIRNTPNAADMALMILLVMSFYLFFGHLYLCKENVPQRGIYSGGY